MGELGLQRTQQKNFTKPPQHDNVCLSEEKGSARGCDGRHGARGADLAQRGANAPAAYLCVRRVCLFVCLFVFCVHCAGW
jgi:hypothetical protein